MREARRGASGNTASQWSMPQCDTTHLYDEWSAVNRFFRGVPLICNPKSLRDWLRPLQHQEMAQPERLQRRVLQRVEAPLQHAAHAGPSRHDVVEAGIDHAAPIPPQQVEFNLESNGGRNLRRFAGLQQHLAIDPQAHPEIGSSQLIQNRLDECDYPCLFGHQEHTQSSERR